jgi:outer membrane protein
MKKIFVTLLFISVCLLSGNTFAQATIKLGHIDSQALLTAMPESDTAQKQYDRESAEAQKTLEEIQKEFNVKYEDYLKLRNDPSTSQLILSTKEEELTTLNQRLQNFQQTAQETLNNRRIELYNPIQEKALKAVQDVAAANGFTYVFDVAPGVGSVVYKSPDSQDIMPLVKAKLGLK